MISQLKIQPRLSETDALGHINNSSVGPWLESGRLNLCFGEAGITEKTVLVRLEMDYLQQIFYGFDQPEVRIETSIEKLGTSSIHYRQEIWQGENRCLVAKAISVAFDQAEGKSTPLSEASRNALNKWLA